MSIDDAALSRAIAREAGERGVRSTRLARGLPSGSQLEFANPAVIGDALKGRTSL